MKPTVFLVKGYEIFTRRWIEKTIIANTQKEALIKAEAYFDEVRSIEVKAS